MTKEELLIFARLVKKVACERSGDEFCEGELYELAVEAEQILKGGAE